MKIYNLLKRTEENRMFEVTMLDPNSPESTIVLALGVILFAGFVIGLLYCVKTNEPPWYKPNDTKDGGK
jgi:hypothetical protein